MAKTVITISNPSIVISEIPVSVSSVDLNPNPIVVNDPDISVDVNITGIRQRSGLFNRFTEVTSFSELFTLATSKLESIALTLVETVTVTLGKLFSEVMTISETITKTADKPVTETASITMTGSADYQNYFLSDYVEPTYCGTTTAL